MSNIVNKVKDALSGHGHHDTSTNTAGPHGSDTANRYDPRVDSDNDGSRTYGDTSGMNTHGSTNAGPHSSNVANKIDPRVDSDLDGSNRTSHTGTTGTGYGNTSSAYTGTEGYGSNTYGAGTGLSGTDTYGSSNTSSGYGTQGGNYGSDNNNNQGPHSSSLANKLDPRVDSDRDGSRATGGNYGGSNYDTGTGSYGSSDTYGSRDNRDDTYGNRNTSGTTGPHSSSLANKLDPRVDSSGDGYRDNNNNTSSGSGPYYGKDTYDAAQVPPSAFQKEAGHHMSTRGSKSGGSLV